MTHRLVKRPAPRRPTLQAAIARDSNIPGTESTKPSGSTNPSNGLQTIVEARQPIYGHPALNFQRTAMVWNGLLANKLVRPITAQDVAIMMAGLKLARLIHTPTHEDSIYDVGGYMSCLEQVNSKRSNGGFDTGLVEGTLADKGLD